MGRVLKFFVLLAAAAAALAPLSRGTVEQVYSRGLYSFAQPRLTSLTNTMPFAWFDALLLLAAGSIVFLWIVRLSRRRSSALKTLGGLVVDTVAIAAILYLWFLAAWGLNYRREPLRTQLDFQEDRITRENLRELGRRNVEALNSLHKDAHARGWPEFDAIPGALAPAFYRAQQDLAMTWRAEPGLPKRSLLNFYFTRVSIDGMTGPFFLETLVNQSLLPFERTATVAHEWSHLAGYAEESEANFLGWLVCMRGSASDRYSGWLSLYFTVLGSLPRGDREALSRALEPGPRQDVEAVRARIQSQVVPIASRAGYALYDRYLKANRVEAGIASYAEVVRLLLGTAFTPDGSPVLRKQAAGN